MIEDRLAEGIDLETREWEAEKIVAEQKRAAWEAKVRKAVEAGSTPPPLPEGAEPPPEVVRPRLTVGDITIESAAEKASQHPRGLLLNRDELAGWIESYDRYSKGSGDRSFGPKPIMAGCSPLIARAARNH